MTLEAVPAWQVAAEHFKAELYTKFPPQWFLPKIASLPANTSTLPSTCGLLTAEEVEITKQSAYTIHDWVVSKKYTAVEVTIAFAKAAAVVHQTTNCLMDFSLEAALKRAQWLDEELARTGKPVGPLHGVPISVKGHVGTDGTITYVGFLSSCCIMPDAILVGILRQAGAIFIARTTVPQAVMHLETDSFLGPTVNPYNRNLTAGGSSGGEGALIGGGGSILGIGSDIGGSIRNPAALQGIYGFKPTVGRLPRGGGGMSIYGGQDSIVGTTGPMARHAEDMSLFMRVVLAAQPWKLSAVCLNMPWREDEVAFRGRGNRPRIGVMRDDGVVRPQPPMRRAMDFAVEKLKAAGFELVEYKPYRSADSWKTIAPLYMTDGGKRCLDLAAQTGEPVLPLTEWIMSASPAVSAYELMDLNYARDAFRHDYLRYFESCNVDVVLCPPGPGPAPKLETSKYWTYTSLWNLLDYPAGVFPTGLAVESTDLPDEPYEFWSADDKQVWSDYDSPESFADAPLSLQIAGPRWEDEKVLRAIEIVSKVVLE